MLADDLTGEYGSESHAAASNPLSGTAYPAGPSSSGTGKLGGLILACPTLCRAPDSDLPADGYLDGEHAPSMPLHTTKPRPESAGASVR